MTVAPPSNVDFNAKAKVALGHIDAAVNAILANPGTIDLTPKTLRFARSEANIGLELLREAKEMPHASWQHPDSAVSMTRDGVYWLNKALQEAPEGQLREKRVSAALFQFDEAAERISNDLDL